MESKIKIKIGPIEIEYEGSEAFLKEELPALIAAVSDLHRESGITESADDAISTVENTNSSSNAATSNGKNLNLTTGSIAARLDVKSGSDLVLAAAARLTLCVGSETFSRAKLLEEMKSATAYYKQTFSKNLSGTLNRLLKEDSIFEVSKNTYSLSAGAKATVESKLAQ